MLPSEGRDLLDFAGRHILGEHAADAFPLPVHFEHYLGRLFAVHGKKILQYEDDELHWSIVVVAQDDLVERRRFGPDLPRLEDGTVTLLRRHADCRNALTLYDLEAIFPITTVFSTPRGQKHEIDANRLTQREEAR